MPVDIPFLSAAELEIAPSLLRLSPTQRIERKQDLSGLAPKNRLVSAESVECIARQISEAQIAVRKVRSRINRVPHGVGYVLRMVCHAIDGLIPLDAESVGAPEESIQRLARLCLSQADLSELVGCCTGRFSS